MTTEQRQIWEREKRAVRRLRDSAGKPVDPGITETVAILRLLGLTTTSSCAGHLDRRVGPWVGFKSPRVAADRERMNHAADRSPEKRRALRLALKHNAAELQTLVGLLDRFYDERAVPSSRRLIVQGFGVVGYNLSSQSADLLRLVPRDQRRALLVSQRDELRAFTDFLKAEFFGTKNDAPSSATPPAPGRE
ncbi:hypothetical protein ACFT5D_07810 [Streptomyces sp. NPDC057144]|uniref:hypothetical protein n=1 Tax=Streptomyces sp. NPDC057144 TaxID=3346034 RepID=UPI00364029BD